MSINFTYFDLGGVVIKDFSASQKWDDLKKSLGVTKHNESTFAEIWQRYQQELCLDRDVDSLMPILETKLGTTYPNNFSILNEFVNRFEANPYINPVLHLAAKRGKVGLLTNAYPRMLNSVYEKKLMPLFEFEPIIDSSVVQLQKPDSAIFEFATKAAVVPPENILFIDNTEGHLTAAQQLGWQTYWFDSSDYVNSCHKLAEFLHTH